MEAIPQPETTAAVHPPSPALLLSRARERASLGLSSAFAAFLGLLPHILHHAGPLAGAALFAGVGGSLLFGALGLLAAIPFLLRLHRRCGNWRVPAATLALFAAMFSISAFVVGPAISGNGDEDPVPASERSTPSAPNGGSAHEAHH